MEKQDKPTYQTQEQAETREKQIEGGSITYTLYLDLQKGEFYTGKISIKFTAKHIDTDSFLDYNNKSVDKLVINGKDSEVKWDQLFITLSKSHLKLGENIVDIDFSCKYANDGCGLHSFIDTDGKQYLYSQCEAYYCHRIFPSFDQPSLKAYLQLTIKAPQDWRVLSNETPNPKKIDSEFYELWFPTTKLLPTYLYGIIAGPYYQIAYAKPYRIQLNLFCRESLFEHLKKISDFMFETTIKSMEMYEDFFGYSYPFNKYDQIFCAEFNSGAMENAGVVTFNDEYCWREEVSSSKTTWLANVISHELAHHWFGNLVTMRWWDDLWLNESFADFISHFCLSKFTVDSAQLQDIWLAFNRRKAWGYRTDQQITTHPIAGQVKNTEAADNIFDGITYAKGASTLKQLLSLVGEKPFSDAMSRYFKKYEFKNATLDDFISNLDIEFVKTNQGFTLSEWKDQWICKAGLNHCQALFNPEDKSNSATLVIQQGAVLEQYNTLRYHKMQVAFFDENANITSQSVLLDPKKETKITYDGSKNFKAVLLNYQDEAFIKALLDPHSIEFFQKNLNKIPDALTRTLIWKSFFDMVRDGQLSAKQYAEIFMEQISKEVSEDLITNQFQFLLQAVQTYVPKKYKEDLFTKLFNFTIDFLSKIDKSKKSLIICAKGYLPYFGYGEKNTEILLDWYNGKCEKLQGFDLGLDIEWRIVCAVHKYSKWSKEEKAGLFKQQQEKDKSDTQVVMKQKCQALSVSTEERKQLWDSYFDKDNKTSAALLRSSWQGFNNIEKLEELKEYYDKWFEVLPKVVAEKPNIFSGYFIEELAPKSENFEELEQKYTDLIKNADQKQLMMIRKLKEALDNLQRKKRAFECFEKKL